MLKHLTLAAVLFALPAAAQTRDCVSAGILSVDSFSFGTSRIPRDPNDPASREQVTATARIRNLTGERVAFSVSFSAPFVMTNFSNGQRFMVGGANVTNVILGNVLRGAASDSAVRGVLRLSCS